MPEERVEIQIRTTADTSGVTQAEQALRKVDTAAKQASQGTTAAGQAAKATTSDLRGLSQAGAGLNQAMNGLSQGGVSGLITAFRGLSNVVKGLATGVFGTVLLAALGAAAAAIAFLTKKANENAEAIKKMYADGDKARASYQAGLAEVKKAAEESLKSQLEAVKALAQGYQDLIGAMDEAAARVGRLRDAEKELEISKIDRSEAVALAQASTPEQREAVKAKAAAERAGINTRYTGAALESNVLNAKNRESQAQRAIAEISARQFEADKEVSAASADYQTALGRISGFSRPPTAEELNQARLAKDRLDAAKANRDAVAEEASKTISAAEREFASAREVQDLAPIRQQTFQNRTATEQVGRMAPGIEAARQSIPGLNDRYSQLEQESKSLTPGWDNERSAQIGAEMSRIAAERDAAYKAIGDFAKTETKARSDIERNLQNTSEASAGR
jgi:hypothetical protein